MLNKMIILVVVMILCPISTSALSQDIKAKTEDGTEVILLPDGTWDYVRNEEPQTLPSSIKTQKPKTLLKGKRGTYGIRIDEDKWRMSEFTFDPEAEFKFAHAAGNAYAKIVDEKMRIPFEQLKNVAFESIKKEAPDVKITFEETRSIHGIGVLYLKMEGTIQSIPSVFLGYYYAGEAGTIQIITYAAKNLIDEFEDDFIEFLDGFEVYTPSQREIILADGSTYSGSIVNAKMHGSGTYTWPNGDQYVGEFTENRASGGWFYKSGGRTVWCYQDEHGIWIIKEH
jgi:hypothetical protein